MNKIQSSSEWVSPGHPDRLADIIAAIIINDIQQKDEFDSHAAVEVFLTHDTIIISGEVTTTLDINAKYLKKVVEEAYIRAGYIPEMSKYWTTEEVMLAENMKIENRIQKQSPDIALGTTNLQDQGGWNDVGIMFSSSEGTNSRRLGIPMLAATIIGEHLHYLSRKSILDEHSIKLGPDIKVVVTCDTDGFNCESISAITISQSHCSDVNIDELREFVKREAITALTNSELRTLRISDKCKWVINGTGKFVVMGSVSDTSMTGRKISVNHPSAGPVYCNKMIGGGSLVKCYHASDFILNVATRFVANVIVRAGLANYAVVGVSCAIGKNELQSMFIYSNNENARVIELIRTFFESKIDWSVAGLVKLFNIFDCEFNFADTVTNNFFGGNEQHSQPWEGDLVDTYAWKLIDFINANY